MRQPDVLVDHCREAMRKGSLSFFLAARLLGKESRDAILMLYAWCRHCDDAVDKEAAFLPPERRMLELDELRRRTWGSMHAPAQARHPVFQAFARLAAGHDIPDHYPQELLSGMQMDLEGRLYRTFDELRHYCWRVAGTVGLMFSHIVGVSDARALRHAADLGMAMQLTNIARDVAEDAAMGRVYLPAAWLAEEGLSPADVGDSACRPAVARVVARLLDAADELYRSGDEGLSYLPLSAAFAVASARLIYAEIGARVRKRGAAAWDERTWVPLPRKLALAAKASARVLSTIPARLARPWRPAELALVWRFE